MLQLINVSKSFPGVRALDRVSLDFRAGEVHALCGENGAGKSTLMNIITGNLSPDEGEIRWQDQSVQIIDVPHSRHLGISIVYQERSLIDTLSVAENVFPDHPPRNRWGLIDYSKLYQATQQLLDRLQLRIRPTTLVRLLSPAQKQMVEIAKALSFNPKLLILDEPTASITEQETETLFAIIRQLRQEGVSIVYISHRMAEILAIANRVSVLKDGAYEGTRPAQETSENEIIRMMVGRELQDAEYVSHARPEVALEVRKLSGPRFHEVSFQLHRGEILGLAGLVGAGRTELARTLFGADPVQSGEVYKAGQRIAPTHPQQMIRHGLAYVPEERKSLGVFLDRSVADNIVSAQLTGGRFDERHNRQVAEALCESLGIRTPSVQQRADKLSGGNQQKVVLAKWLHTQPDILMVDEPTHGVDVGAKAEIYRILKQLTAEGKSILLISSELPELRLLSDRIAVMRQGRLTQILTRAQADEETIMHYATTTRP